MRILLSKNRGRNHSNVKRETVRANSHITHAKVQVTFLFFGRKHIATAKQSKKTKHKRPKKLRGSRPVVGATVHRFLWLGNRGDFLVESST